MSLGIRSKEDVQKLTQALEKEYERLPDENSFGESNKEVKAENARLIKDLKNVLDGGEAQEDMVIEWLEGNKYSELNDYL